MTERLYFENQYIREFKAAVLSCNWVKEKYEVILDRSAFFPEGGGQPGDRGRIGDAVVSDTIEKNGEVIHICDRSVSGENTCIIDWDYRFLNMQQHTGEHIFSGFIHKLTGYDNVGFHMGENEVTVDFNGPVSEDQLIEAENLANDTVYRNVKIIALYPADAELVNYDYRSKKEIEGQVRLIEIEGADLCACCGTHTAYSGEVGIIKVTSCMNYKQGVRITLKIGKKALIDYRNKNNSVAEISALLCSKTEEVTDYVMKLKNKNNEIKTENYEIKKALFSAMCENRDSSEPFVFYDSGETEDARMLADILAEKVNIAFAFSGNDETGYKYAVVSHNEDLSQHAKKINAALSGRGGGKPEIVMGSVNETKENIINYFKQ